MCYLHFVLYIMFDRPPGHIHIDGRAKDIDPTEAILVDIQDPVSYTHLTLPTNREV